MEIKIPRKIYKIKKNIVYSCQYHVIFCPKFRRQILKEKIAERLHELILDLQNENEFQVIDIDIMPEHVHMILDINPKIGIYHIVSHLKRYTAGILRKEFKDIRTKIPSMWTNSSFISTVGLMNLEDVRQYIVDQKGI